MKDTILLDLQNKIVNKYMTNKYLNGHQEGLFKKLLKYQKEDNFFKIMANCPSIDNFINLLVSKYAKIIYNFKNMEEEEFIKYTNTQGDNFEKNLLEICKFYKIM